MTDAASSTPSSPVLYLTLEELLLIARNAIGAPPVVRDYGLLESAVARPQTNVFGADAYPDLWTKAAALGHSLIHNHPLLDGNKRLGWVAMRTFLQLNGVPPMRVNVAEAEQFVLAVAAGELSDVSEIAKRLRELPGHGASVIRE